MNSRRQFLSFLTASPFALAQPDLLTDPKDALSVLDFEEAARRTLPIAHWAYVASGVDDDATVRANREGFKKFALRPRRLIDISQIDTSIELFGVKWESPVYISACGSQRALNPDGELSTARAAKAKNAAQMLSTASTTPYEDVAAALGRPPWFQLYAPRKWPAVQALLRRVESAGCQVVFLTVDQTGGRNAETMKRLGRTDTRPCLTCHKVMPLTQVGARTERPMLAGLDSGGTNSPALTWEFVDRLKNATRMKLVLKGLQTAEDAALACCHGVDGIIVSNHGGRAEDGDRATIEVLPEVIAEVRGRIPVLVDSGFRRGTDVFKALALGATAVGIGRPYLWGLSAFGQAGVERVLEILRAELALTMGQCGTPSVRAIKPQSVARV
jgi:4-hydroxymandelate oxidase